MKNLNGLIVDAYTSWLSDAVSCCTPLFREEDAEHPEYPSSRHYEKEMTAVHDQQPQLVPPPRLEAPTERTSTSRTRELVARGQKYASRAASRGRFTARRRLNAYNPYSFPRGRPREMCIGAPTDFRHVNTSSPLPPVRRTGFRPLELNIYCPDNRLSPILPYLGLDEQQPLLKVPAPALTHARSDTALSNFTIPRKPLHYHNSALGRLERPERPSVDEDEGITPSSASSEWVMQPLRPRPNVSASTSTQQLIADLAKELPKLPLLARLKTDVDSSRTLRRRGDEQIERIASALNEKIEIERRIQDYDSVIEERRSIYLSSRPSSVYTRNTFEEPLPSVPTSLLPTPSPPSKPLLTTTSSAPSIPFFLPVRPPTSGPSITNPLLPITRPSNPTRSHTAPPRPTVHIPIRSRPFHELQASAIASSSPLNTRNPSFSSAKSSHSHFRSHSTKQQIQIPQHQEQATPSPEDHSPIPPPPLPLVLTKDRPPLRKKKSFSRVSSWLYGDKSARGRGMSLDSVTNDPKPVTAKEGFYMCVDPAAIALAASQNQNMHHARMSEDAVSSNYSEVEEGEGIGGRWEGDNWAEETAGTAPTLTSAWTPESSPTPGRGTGGEGVRMTFGERVRAMSMDEVFGCEGMEEEGEIGRWRGDEIKEMRLSRVGVAF